MGEQMLNDAMPSRKLAARWVIRGTLTVKTALHLGGEGTNRVDMPVLRNAVDGRPLLPGSTFAGALRSALADRLAGYAKQEPSKVAELFGGMRGNESGSQSPLIVFDAFGELPSGQGVEVRDGVSISPTTGVAEDHEKYDYEVLPPGTKFPVRVDLLVPAAQVEKSLLEHLAAALDAFSSAERALGSRRSRGLGRVRAVWAARRFELGTRRGWLEWILSDHEFPLAAEPDRTCVRDVLEAACPENLKPLSLLGDARKRVVIELVLRLDHDILIRSPGTDPDAPDVSHLHSGGFAVLPGTSLAGVMRAQALRIAKLVRDQKSDGPDWVDRLFGMRIEGRRPSGKFKPQASRLHIGEARLDNSRPQRQTRTAIDRFTGGVVDTALFDEQTEVGGQATVRLELRNFENGELGLVLLVVKDLLDGSLAVGGSSSVGRGVLHGSATVTWHDDVRAVARTASIEPGKQPEADAAEEIDKAIHAFHDAPAIGIRVSP